MTFKGRVSRLKKNTKILIKIGALIISFVMLFTMLPNNMASAADKPAVAPTTAQKTVIKKAATFLEDMGMKPMADNVRKWLKDGKIKVDPDMSANGTTNSKGEITLKGSFVAPLPTGDLAKFKRVADLAQLLLHEKTHAHQAPSGNALATNVQKGDWVASGDVMKECVGPEATEVDAHYKQIRAYLIWAKKIKAEAISSSLSKADKAKAQTLKDEKVKWLLKQVNRWSKILKALNYEKANKFKDVDPLADKLKKIDDDTKLTEDQKIAKKIALLDSLISKLFDKDNFYDRARKLFAKKKGTAKTTAVTPITPGASVTLSTPTGLGVLSISSLPEAINVGDSSEFAIEIYDFLIPPEPDPGYAIVSPVYLVEWNALTPVPFTLSLSVESMGSSNLKIAAFGMAKTDVNSMWTLLDTTTMEGGGMSTLSATSDMATMYCVVMPVPTYTDLSENHWAYNMVERLVSANVLEPAEVLQPNMEVTRELFVKYLVKALGLEISDDDVPFNDIDTLNPYFPYISTAYAVGLTTGVEIDRFGMGEIISREQSITFLIRALGMEDEAIALSDNEILFYLSLYTDMISGNSSWAYPYLTQGVIKGIVKGYPDSTMRGKNPLNHGEVIALIDRMMTYIKYNGN